MNGRITQSMISTTLIRNLNQNMGRMSNLQDQLATGKRINKPSDDPVGISYTMRYRSELAANDQYQSNVDSGISWLENTDTTLGQAVDVLQRVRELTVDAANGTHPQYALDAIGKEVKEMRDQLVDVGNTNFNGKYVFNGQMTDVKPYSLDSSSGSSPDPDLDPDLDPDPVVEPDPASVSIMNTDTGTIQFEIGVGVKMAVNVTGNKVFGTEDDEDNAFRVLDELMSAISNGDQEEVSELIGKIDSRIDAMLRERSDIGAKSNRLEFASERLKDVNSNLQTLQTKTEDVDIALTITNLKTSENVFQASLSVGSQIIKPSLIDFLR